MSFAHFRTSLTSWVFSLAFDREFHLFPPDCCTGPKNKPLYFGTRFFAVLSDYYSISCGKWGNDRRIRPGHCCSLSTSHLLNTPTTRLITWWLLPKLPKNGPGNTWCQKNCGWFSSYCSFLCQWQIQYSHNSGNFWWTTGYGWISNTRHLIY